MRPLVPPPVQAIAALVLIWMASRWLPGWNIHFPGQAIVAAVIAATGVAIDVVSLAAFRRSDTTVNPLKPEDASALVISGMYRVSRNPMYLGMLLIIVGFALWRGNPLGVLIIGLFMLSITITQIRPEERALTALFGDAYAEYCARVRRWL